MIETAARDPTPFIAASFILTAVVVAAVVVLSLVELRYWARRARALEAERAALSGVKDEADARERS